MSRCWQRAPEVYDPAIAEVRHIDELEQIEVAGIRWRPIRRALGITGFGINTYSADAGQDLIEEHDETGSGAGDRERACDHLARAFALDPQARDWAASDPDLDSIRSDPQYPS